MSKVTYSLPGGAIVELEASNIEKMWDDLGFLQSLPLDCPIDGMPTRFEVRRSGKKADKKGVWYHIISTGPIPYKWPVSKRQEDNGWYSKGIWELYDDSTKTDIILINKGHVTKEGKKHIDRWRREIASADAPQLQDDESEDDQEDGNEGTQPSPPPNGPQHRQTATNGNGTHNEATAHSNGTPAAQQAPPANPALEGKRKIFHALGIALMGSEGWKINRVFEIKAVLNQQISSNDLNIEQLDQLIQVLEGKVREACKMHARALQMTVREVGDIVSKATAFGGKAGTRDLDQARGVGLAHVCNELTKLQGTPKEETIPA